MPRALIFWIMCLSPAVALSGEMDQCINQNIEACTKEIKSTTGEVKAMAYENRAEVYFNQGNYDLAIADFTESIRLTSRKVYLYSFRGNAYLMKGDVNHALADFNKFLQTSANDPSMTGDMVRSVKFSRAKTLRSLGQYEKAIEDFRDVLWSDKVYNLRANSHLLERGRTYAMMGEVALAEADFKKVLSLPAIDQVDQQAEELARAQLAALEKGQVPSTSSGAAPTTVAQLPTPMVTPLGEDGGKRIALVIGNSAYRTVNPLKNPEADAHAVAEEFRRLGFAEVIEKHDLALADLSAELKSFGDKALDTDWAVIYYAGHGIEVGGVNYVIPIDAELKTSAHVEEEAIPLDRVLSKVEGAHKLRLVILDACRDNPFAQRIASAGGGTRSVGRGLARVEPVGGVMVAYSARDGHLAQDGDAANSPFAQALIQNLEEPGIEVGLLFRKVHDAVWDETHGEQEPFTYGALPAEALYFKIAGQ
jgi:tetratricopeptide (TPR) repeat protein